MQQIEISNLAMMSIDVLVLLFVLVAAFALIKARRNGASPRSIGMTLLAATAFGLFNAWMRTHYPAAQPPMVLAMIAGLVAVGMSKPGRTYFAAIDLAPIIALNGWRILFGGLLLTSGLTGGLPPAFYPTVAAGDIIAGIWALSISARGCVNRQELVAWNLFGLADLIHVLPLATINLPPFFATHPDLLPPRLLPLLGVPFLIALHICILFLQWRAPET